MPQGTGDYRRVGRSVNGILFEWVGPGAGDFVPIRLLPKPKIQRLVDLNAVIEPLPGVELFGEWAQSENDLNRLSDIDSEDDIGAAYVAGIRVQPTVLNLGARDVGKVSGQFRRRGDGCVL